jgi:hypothetical protein
MKKILYVFVAVAIITIAIFAVVNKGHKNQTNPPVSIILDLDADNIQNPPDNCVLVIGDHPIAINQDNEPDVWKNQRY